MNTKKAVYFFSLIMMMLQLNDSRINNQLQDYFEIDSVYLNTEEIKITSSNETVDNQTRTTLIPSGSKLLIAGDSLAVGMSDEFVRIAKRRGYIPHTHAIVGTNAIQWVKWIESDITKYSPKLVIVSLGTNDAMIIDQIRKFDNIYRDIQDVVERNGAVLVWIGPPKLPREKIPHATEIRTILLTTIHNYFDSERLNIARGVDKIHSTPIGYNAWMKEVWSWMEQKSLVATEKNIE